MWTKIEATTRQDQSAHRTEIRFVLMVRSSKRQCARNHAQESLKAVQKSVTSMTECSCAWRHARKKRQDLSCPYFRLFFDGATGMEHWIY